MTIKRATGIVVITLITSITVWLWNNTNQFQMYDTHTMRRLISDINANSNGFEKSPQNKRKHAGFSNHIRKQLKTTRPIPPMPRRTDIAEYLEKETFTIGAEVGVQAGEFAKSTLDNWPSCKLYYLIDVWKHQPKNYLAQSNVPDSEHEKFYEKTIKLLDSYASKIKILRTYSTDAAKLIPDNSLDYVYIDARHDYCGVTEDLHSYWPKVRSGGIIAGHDFVTVAETRVNVPHEEWSVCENGTRIEGAVKGAVLQFAQDKHLQVLVTYTEWPSWIIRKP